MADILVTATLYLLFAICFSVFNILQLNIIDSHEIYTSLIHKFAERDYKPGKSLKQGVQSADDIYLWVREAFLPGIYDNQPTLSDDIFCYPGTNTCKLGEGNVKSNYQCDKYLVKGQNNCNVWMSPGKSCCEPCENVAVTEPSTSRRLTSSTMSNAGQSIDPYNLKNHPFFLNPFVVQKEVESKQKQYKEWKDQIIVDQNHQDNINRHPEDFDHRRLGGTTIIGGTKRPSAVCTNTTIDLPKMFWEFDLRVDNLSENCQVQSPTPPWLVNFHNPPGLEGQKFCPEYLPSSDWPPRVFSFNSLVVARLTLKRAKFVKHQSNRFAKSYSYVKKMPDGNALNTDLSQEDTDPFGLSLTGQSVYSKGEGYSNSGGFVEFLHPEFTLSKAKNLLIEMKSNNWFDKAKLSSFVVEIILYNGNVEKFMHISFIFEVKANGMIKHRIVPIPFSVNLYADASINYIRMFLEAVVVGLFVFFVKQEAKAISDGVLRYISKALSWVSMLSLMMCFICIVLYIVYVTSHEFQSVELPLPQNTTGGIGLRTSPERKHAIGFFQFLSERSAAVSIVAACNICIIFIRCIALLASTSPNLGLVLKSLGQGQESFLCFIFIFVLLFTGFALSGHLQFGANIEEFSTVSDSFLACLRMIIGDFDMKRMSKNAQNPGFLQIWFVVFMSFFYLVLINMFLSIIVSSYNKEVKYLKELEELHGEIDSLKKFVQSCAKWISNKFSFLNRLKMLTSLKAGSSGKKLNFEVVNRLRAQKRKQSYPGSCHCVSVLLLFFIFVIAITRKCRVLESYRLEKAVLEGVKDVLWTTSDGKMQMGYNDVHTMEEVKDFIQVGIVDNLYACISDSKAVDSKQVPTKTCEYYQKKIKQYPLEYKTREFKHWVLWNGSGMGGGVVGGHRRRLDETILGENIKDENEIEDNPQDIIQDYIRKNNENEKDSDRKSNLKYDYNRKEKMIDFRTGMIIEDDYDEFYSSDDSLFDDNSSDDNKEYLRHLSRSGSDADWNGVELKSPSLGYVYDYRWHSAITEAIPESEATSTTSSKMISLYDFQPRFREWNVGIMQDNFVRLTIDMACYKPNKKKRWIRGFPNILQDGKMKDWIDDKECKSFGGKSLNNKRLYKGASGMIYHYSESTSYEKQGGYVIGFGQTKEEAQKVLDILIADNFFSNKAIELTFDWITYNPNYDLFAYNVAQFHLSRTAELHKNIKATVFPVVNFYNGGPTEKLSTERLINTILFGIYVLLVLWLTITVILFEFYLQFQISQELGQNIIGTITSFFSEDPWNYISVLSAIFNVFVILLWIQFTETDFNKEMTTKYQITPKQAFNNSGGGGLKNDLEISTDMNMFNEFNEAASRYNAFIFVAAINAFLLAIRLVKYFGEISCTASYRQDEYPRDEIVYEFDENLEKAYVGIESFNSTTNYPAESSGVRPGWILESINEIKFTNMLKRARDQAEKEGTPFNSKVWFDMFIAELEPPCQLGFRSQTGIMGTIVCALGRCLDQVFKFTIVLMTLLLGFAILFHIEYGVSVKAFSTLPDSIISLFRFMMGDLSSLKELLEQKYIFTYILFWIFQLLFFFILSKQFLGVMVFSWKVHREEKQIPGIYSNIKLISNNAITFSPFLMGIFQKFLFRRHGEKKEDDNNTINNIGAADVGEVLEPMSDAYWQEIGVLKSIFKIQKDFTINKIEWDKEDDEEENGGAIIVGNGDVTTGNDGGMILTGDSSGETEDNIDNSEIGKLVSVTTTHSTPRGKITLLDSEEDDLRLKEILRLSDKDLRKELIGDTDFAGLLVKKITDILKIGTIELTLVHACLKPSDRKAVLDQIISKSFQEISNRASAEQLQMPQFLSKNTKQKIRENHQDELINYTDGTLVMYELLLDVFMHCLEAGEVILGIREQFDKKNPVFEPKSKKERALIDHRIITVAKRMELVRSLIEVKVRKKMLHWLSSEGKKKIQIIKDQTVIMFSYSEDFVSKIAQVDQQREDIIKKHEQLQKKLKPLVVSPKRNNR